MNPALPMLTLPKLRSTFARQLPLPAKDSANFQPDTLDRALLANIDELLGEYADNSPVPTDVSLDVDMARALSRFEHLTEGARLLVQEARSLDRAITVILSDEGIKAYLRSSLQSDLKIKRLNLLLASLASPDCAIEGKRPSFTRRSFRASRIFSAKALGAIARKAQAVKKPLAVVLPKRKAGKGTASTLTIVLQDEARTLSPAARVLLGLHLPKTFAFRDSSHERRCSVGALIGALETYDAAAQVCAALDGLFRSDLRFLLIKLVELSDRGDVTFATAALAMLKIFAMRVYSQLQAVRSAEGIGRSLLETPALLEALPEGERRRLHDLLARCAQRSGRALEALQRYRDIAALHPDEAGPLVNYIAAVHRTDLPEAIAYAKLILSNQYAVSANSLIFIGDLLAYNAEQDLALSAFHKILQHRVNFSDAYLGLANLALVKGRTDTWKLWVQRFLQFHHLPAVQFRAETVPAPFGIMPPERQKHVRSPKVSVVMTSFNAGATLNFAVRSVLDQTVSNLELFIVDDRSEDSSREIIRSLANEDSRIKFIFNDRNMGTYESKNRAIRQCSGDFITFHDSDDWMHSKRLENHLNAMKPGIICSTSNWVRMDSGGRIIVHRDGPYTHVNPASTFFRREILTRIGSFDSARTGADSEFLMRIRHRMGQSVIAQLSDVLGIGLHHEASLTRSGPAAFDEYRYSQVRVEYVEAWVKWHLSILMHDREALSLNSHAGARPFEAQTQVTP
jgi:hypothetical protein